MPTGDDEEQPKRRVRHKVPAVPVDRAAREQHKLSLVATPGERAARTKSLRRQKVVHLQLEGKMAELYRGERSVEDMDIEELARMQFRDRRGGFTGRPPTNLPRQLVESMRAEMRKRLDAELQRNAMEVLKVLGEIALNAEVGAGDRIKAVQAYLDRYLGKAPQTIEHTTGDKPFEVTIARGIDRSLPEEDD